jgi:hypothetical protein
VETDGFDEDGERRGGLSSTRIIEKESGERWDSILEDLDQCASWRGTA